MIAYRRGAGHRGVYLADRVLALSLSPVTVVQTLKTGLPSPRDQITSRGGDSCVRGAHLIRR